MFRSRSLLPLLCSLLLVGCDGDPMKIQVNDAPAEVVVTALETGEPVAGVKIVAVATADNLPVAGPFVTDTAGRIVFGLPPWKISGYLFFGGLDWQLHNQYPPTLKTAAAKTSPPEYNPLTRMVVRRSPPADGLPRIAGTVVDAVTGEPLHQAFIGTTPHLTAYNGRSDPGADVTGTDGAFRVQEIVFALHPETGNLTQVDLMFISRQGYRPRSWVYHHANGDNNLDISGVRIPLTPLSAADTGVLTGRIMIDGAPRSQVWVGLGGFATDKNGVGLPGQTALTDTAGIFRFTGLATGTYVVDPGFMLQDRFVFPNQAQPQAYDVTSGQTTTAADLDIVWEIKTEYGAQTTFRIGAGTALLDWTPVRGAVEYAVYVERAAPVRTSEARLEWTISPTTVPGWYRWTVIAESDTGKLLGSMQKEVWMQLVE